MTDLFENFKTLETICVLPYVSDVAFRKVVCRYASETHTLPSMTETTSRQIWIICHACGQAEFKEGCM